MLESLSKLQAVLPEFQSRIKTEMQEHEERKARQTATKQHEDLIRGFSKQQAPGPGSSTAFRAGGQTQHAQYFVGHQGGLTAAAVSNLRVEEQWQKGGCAEWNGYVCKRQVQGKTCPYQKCHEHVVTGWSHTARYPRGRWPKVSARSQSGKGDIITSIKMHARSCMSIKQDDFGRQAII